MRRSTPVTPGFCVLFFFFFLLKNQYWSFILENKKLMLSSFQIGIQSRDYIFMHKNKWKPRRKWDAENSICSNTIYSDSVKHSRLCYQSMGSTRWCALRRATSGRYSKDNLILPQHCILLVKAQGSAYYITKPERICLYIACAKAP